MKFLMISTSVIPVGAGKYGGIEKMCEDLARGLHQAGHVVTVAAPFGSSLPNPIRVIPTVKLPDEQDRDDIAVARLAEAKGKDYDIILDFSHGHALGRDPSSRGQFPLLAMVWDNITVKYTKSLYNIGCVSDWQRERFMALYGQAAKTVPKWGYVDGSRYKPAKNPRRERYLFLGKLSPDKGAAEAIAFADDLGVGLDVVGGLLATDNRAYANSLGAGLIGQNKARLYFNADEWHKIDLLQNAKAVIYPVQFDEAHNLVAIEAAACGTPFIQYRRGAIGAQPELAEELGATVVDTPEDFLEAMRDCLNFETTKIDWTIKGRIPTYISFFEKIIGGGRW